jgi:DNA-directed RNA polymerase subunit RPC12/RpoP
MIEIKCPYCGHRMEVEDFEDWEYSSVTFYGFISCRTEYCRECYREFRLDIKKRINGFDS